jgi:pimeloyl-ACP methyl ester carboxylesterase
LLFGKHWDIAAARALKMPVLIVTGTYDGIFAPEMMRMLHNELKGSQLYEIENAGHSPYFERPGGVESGNS